MSEEFYIQDTRSYVGNAMLWWQKDNCGYVCDIERARVFTKDEARKICRGRGKHIWTSRDKKRMWPKKYIDERVSHYIDMQDCDFEQAKAKKVRD